MSSEKVLKTWKTEKDTYEDFKDICRKERVNLGDKINGFIEDYLKEHKDGNPQYTIDQFKDPDFIACPAFYRDNMAWYNYCSKSTPQELEKLKAQILMIEQQTLKFL